MTRSVTLLEEAVGQPLFTRLGRRIQLNPAGLTLLAAVRDAMRRVDDGLGGGSSTAPSRFRVAGHPAWLSLLLVPLVAELPFTLDHIELDPAGIRGALLSGTIDLALAETIPPSDDILVERVGTVARAVCASARGGSSDAFAVSTDILDGWPADLPRSVQLRSPRLEVAIEACRAGALRCVMPVAIARTHRLRILRSPKLPPSQLYLARRAPVSESALDSVVAALRKRAVRLLR